jgi:hypothetical protein
MEEHTKENVHFKDLKRNKDSQKCEKYITHNIWL